MKQVRESFSALMDNEADEFDLRRVLKQMQGGAAEADTWRRYHLARSMMRREQDAMVNIDISGDVMAALADEPQPMSATSPHEPKRHSFSLMSGAAVAAAVSLMVITGVQVVNGRFADDTSSTTDVASTDAMPSGSSSGGFAFSSQEPASGSGVMPASMQAPASNGLPYFPMNGVAGSGLMTIGDDVSSPMLFSADTGGNAGIDREQVQTLQSYLERQSLGATYGAGDNWVPLLRSQGSYASQLHDAGTSGTR